MSTSSLPSTVDRHQTFLAADLSFLDTRAAGRVFAILGTQFLEIVFLARFRGFAANP